MVISIFLFLNKIFFVLSSLDFSPICTYAWDMTHLKQIILIFFSISLVCAKNKHFIYFSRCDAVKYEITAVKEGGWDGKSYVHWKWKEILLYSDMKRILRCWTFSTSASILSTSPSLSQKNILKAYWIQRIFFDCSISNAERELNVIYLIDDISQCVFIYVMEKSDSLSLLQGSLRQQQRSLSHNIDIDTRRND